MKQLILTTEQMELISDRMVNTGASHVIIKEINGDEISFLMQHGDDDMTIYHIDQNANCINEEPA